MRLLVLKILLVENAEERKSWNRLSHITLARKGWKAETYED